MAGNNTIGTGTLTLVASADKLAAGIDTAKKTAVDGANDIAKKVDAKTGEGGGFLGKLFSGAAIGVGVALAMKAFESIGKAWDEMKAKGQDGGVFAGVENAFTSLKDSALGALSGVIKSIAPALILFAEKVSKFFDDNKDAIAAVADVLGTLGYVVIEVLGEFLTLVGEVLSAVGEWIGSIFGVSDTMESAGEIMMGVLRAVGKGIAYVWDTLKAGAGAIAYVAGFIVEGFSKVIGIIASVASALADLAEAAGVGGETTRKIANTVKGWEGTIADTGKGMRAWGKDAIAGFGSSAGKVDAWFDKVSDKMKQTKAELAETITTPTDVKLSGAFDRGSSGAYSILAKYATGNMLTATMDKQQLDQLKNINKGVQDMAKKPPFVLKPI